MKKKVFNFESFVFLLFALANTYPVLAHHFFPTLDGVVHLYNARCINEMIAGNLFIQSFMTWNPFPNPNWTGHFIMSLSNLFLPAYLAEKVLLLCYLIGLPYGFRYLVKALQPENRLVSYLIFPFCYTYMFFLGFYNFSVSLVFLFFTIGFWVRYKDKLNPYKIAVLMLLVTAIYFSHVSVYAMLFPVLFGLLFIDETVLLLHRKNTFGEYFRAMAIKTGWLIVSFSITAWWTFQFFRHKPSSVNTYLPDAEMYRNIRVIEPLIGFIQPDEARYTGKIFYVLVFLALVVLIKRISCLKLGLGFSLRTFGEKLKKLFNKGDLWLVFGSVFLAAYFVLPDSDGWAGYFSLRILLLFFLMFLVWLGTQKIPKFFLIISIIAVLFFHIRLVIFRDKITGSLNQTAMQCYKASEFVEENSTVFAVNRTENWLHGHFDKYLGIDKAVVMLENSECNENYFPLSWNREHIPHMYLDDSGALDSCFTTTFNGSKGRQKIDYIYIMGKPDTISLCDKKLLRFTQQFCKKVYDDGYFTLHKIRTNSNP